MNTRGYSAYNLARGALLNSKLTLADSGNQPLKLLDIVVSGMGMDSTAGLWLVPLHAIPAVPRVFPFDLIYLDKEYRVLDSAEMGPGIEFPAFHQNVTSALVLPSETLRHTGTAPGDRLIVCVSKELEALLAASSLPSPDAAESVHDPAITALSGAKPPTPGMIELTPERPPRSPSAPATIFEQSILTAVAKVAETRSVMATKPPDLPQTPGPGPSLGIAEAILDSPRQVQPAIVEHRIDPEDLFSNWVVSAPPTPQKGRIPPSRPPASPDAEVATPETRPETAKQNGRKSPTAARSAAESPTQPRSTAAEAPPPKFQSRAKSASEASEQPVPPARAKASPSAKPEEPVKAATVVQNLPPATTFTAVPYGMWQVSMPTAVAPMAGAKSPQPKAAFTPNRIKSTKEPDSPKAAAAVPENTKASSSPAAYEIKAAPPQPALKPLAGTDSISGTAQIPSPPKPVLRDAAFSEPHRPGDFVASLQEKLQRVQQARPAPTALPANTAPQSQIAASASTSPPPILPSQPGPYKAGPEAFSAKTTAVGDSAKVAPATVPKSKAASPPSAKPATEPSPGGFRSKFRQWLHPNSSPSDRRRASRRYVPGMVAHYFTGGAPKPKNVADISMSGMYLLTDDRWMPGTMIQMTLQKPCASGEKKQSINVLSRIVRRGSDGVAAEFVMPEALSHISHDIQPSQATDKFALARFL